VSLADKFRELARLFEMHGIDAPAREAELLMTETFSVTKMKLLTANAEISKELSALIDGLAARRIKGEPMHYIIGHVMFYGLMIHVGKGVLIPRPETELMVEHTLKLIKTEIRSRRADSAFREPKVMILDLCTGSGCIALALANEIRQSVVTGVDLSDAALSYARRNAGHNGVGNVTFIQGDLFGPIRADETFDYIISNPPYIRRRDMDKLQVEIREHEPIEALDGGADGLDVYRRIFREAPLFLKDDGMLILEIGADQAEDIRQLAAGAGFGDFGFIRDYAGIERIFIGKK
jgi:release factor glutamine methyltransferase